MVNETVSDTRKQTISLLIMREREYLVGQCLEYDIAVQGRTLEEVHQRFRAMVIDHALLAMEYGDEPFSTLEPAPASYQHRWHNASKLGLLKEAVHFELPKMITGNVPQKADLVIC